MNWNHFLLILAGLYLGYYTINIITDLYLHQKLPGDDADQDVLFFSEDTRPEIILFEDGPETPVVSTPAHQPVPESVQNYPSPPLESTGAVSLKELVRVTQSGVIQYTKAIPY